MFGRIHQLNHLALAFLLGKFVITDSISLLVMVCSAQIFYSLEIEVGCIFVGIYPLLLDFSIFWHIIREIQVKQQWDITSHLLEWLLTKRQELKKGSWRYGEKWTLIHCWWECKLAQTLWKQYDGSSPN